MSCRLHFRTKFLIRYFLNSQNFFRKVLRKFKDVQIKHVLFFSCKNSLFLLQLPLSCAKHIYEFLCIFNRSFRTSVFKDLFKSYCSYQWCIIYVHFQYFLFISNTKFNDFLDNSIFKHFLTSSINKLIHF